MLYKRNETYPRVYGLGRGETGLTARGLLAFQKLVTRVGSGSPTATLVAVLGPLLLTTMV